LSKPGFWVITKKRKNEKGSHKEGGVSLQEVGERIDPAQTAAPSALQLGKNELRIMYMDSVGGDGVSYAVLAHDNGTPCALIPTKNSRIAKCKVGQIVVWKEMVSDRNAKVIHSECNLSVLDFVGLGRSGI
jgi:hypothetical protein